MRVFRTRTPDERPTISFAEGIYALELLGSIQIRDANKARSKVGATL